MKGHVDYDKNNWLVGLVNAAPYIAAALLYVPLDSFPMNFSVEILFIAVAGFQIHSTTISDVAVPSSSAQSSVSSQSSVPLFAKAGNNFSSAVCCSALVWVLKRPRSQFSLPKTSPLRLEVVWL